MSDQHDTPVTFTRAEMREIRAALGGDEEAQCPHCKNPLSIREPVAGGTQRPVWCVKCDHCHRAAFLTEPPGGHRYEAGS